MDAHEEWWTNKHLLSANNSISVLQAILLMNAKCLLLKQSVTKLLFSFDDRATYFHSKIETVFNSASSAAHLSNSETNTSINSSMRHKRHLKP